MWWHCEGPWDFQYRHPRGILLRIQGVIQGGMYIHPFLPMASNLVRFVRRKLIGEGKCCGRGGAARGVQAFNTDVVEGREEVGWSRDATL